MTDKERLKKALEALRYVHKGVWNNHHDIRGYAYDVIRELTAPRMKTVDRWICPKCEAVYNYDGECCAEPRIKFTYSRPIEEKEEVWEGYTFENGVVQIHGVFPSTGIPVEVRLKGE